MTPERPLACSLDALRRVSYGWVNLYANEVEFFARWAIEYAKMKAFRRAWARSSYKRHAERRRKDARDQRDRMKEDPVRLAAYREYCRRKMKERRENDIQFRIRFRLRGRIWGALSRGVAKSGRTVELLGCSIGEFKSYLEARWQPGMTWENYGRGGWHIDHVKPCADFDLSQPAEQRRCFHFTNCQPLWELENLSKGAKTTTHGECQV